MLMRIALLLTAAALTFAQSPADLDRTWREAILKKEFAAVEKMLADDLVYAHATGIVDTKASYIAKLRSGRQLYRTMEQKNVSVRTYGDTAVTHSWMHVTGINQSGEFNDKVMMLHVWIKKGGRWLLAGHQTTRVDQIP
jgi:ketosteroid isomerase-like protein